MKTIWFRTAILTMLLLPCLVGAADLGNDFFAQFSGETIYPTPQEKVLDTIKEPFDRVIWLYRAYCQSQQRAGAGSTIDTMLAEALRAHHREECWLFAKGLVRNLQKGKNKAIDKWQICLDYLSLPEDVAAFVPVFEGLPEILASRFSSYRQLALQQAAALDDQAVLASYTAKTTFDEDFYKKKRPWHHLVDFVKTGVDGLLARLEAKFCKENLIRFFARVQRWKVSDGLRQAAGRAEHRLLERLFTDVDDDFTDRIAGGLTTKTELVVLGQGGVMQTTAFFNGRLRKFSKRLQAYQDGRDIKLFLPVLKKMQRRALHLHMSTEGLETDTKAYLKKAGATLDTMATMLALKARRQTEEDAESALWQSIRLAVDEFDEEGIFSGL